MISKERKQLLDPLIAYISSKLKEGGSINLNFICTHNSRRSHLAQIWAQCAAWKYRFNHVYCYSGGTEATALFPMIAKTLEDQGLKVLRLSTSENPIYAIRYSSANPPIIAFSKRYNHPFNPSSDFAAIMTCNDADAHCPLVEGAEERIAITYEDPKASDGTTEQQQVYLKRSEQIKTEMEFIFKSLRLRMKGKFAKD